MWTPPNHVSSGEASSSQFNAETVDNLIHLHDRIQAGNVLVDFDSEIAANADITFPTAFGGAPFITATVMHGTFTGTAAVYAVRGGNVTTVGCRIRVYRVDSATPITAMLEVHWIAFGPPAT